MRIKHLAVERTLPAAAMVKHPELTTAECVGAVLWRAAVAAA